MERTCKVAGCTSTKFAGAAKGYCSKHYNRRQRRQPLTEASQYEKSVEQRFWEKVTKREDGCWEWTGFREPKGYGYFRATPGKVEKAHRWAYEHFVAPIPEGMTIDHYVCFRTWCVNPEHLEVVTRAVNTSRARRRTLASKQ